jgi:UDP-N-acetyl-D-mannosaminuronate dehydrogenase
VEITILWDMTTYSLLNFAIVSEEHSASFFTVKEKSKQTARERAANVNSTSDIRLARCPERTNRGKQSSKK